jgi:hypothetical protein
MQEGPIKENSYYYPASQIQKFLESLPITEAIEDKYLGTIDEKIVIMTHDDEFDPEMYKRERELGFESTWFLLDTKINADIPENADIHIHFNKESGILSEQIKAFKSRFGFEPRFNRNHRLLWRANNFDFPLLSMNGILVDTTLIGTKPYRPTINGRIIPIWEVPFCITDKSNRFMASYCPAKDYETPFKQGLSPIVVLSHPFSICKEYELKSCFLDCISLAQKYGYKIINLDRLYKEFLLERSQ